jgi:hypothetical protein
VRVSPTLTGPVGVTDFDATTHDGVPNEMSSRKFPIVGFPLPVGAETKAKRVTVWLAGTT